MNPIAMLMTGEAEQLATALETRGLLAEAQAVRDGAAKAKAGQMGFREQCTGAWEFDRSVFHGAWNTEATPEARAVIVAEVWGTHGVWWDRRSQLDRRGKYWFRRPCANLDPSGMCRPCRERQARDLAVAHEMADTPAPPQPAKDSGTWRRSMP